MKDYLLKLFFNNLRLVLEIFSILTISSLTGIIAFLCIQGFYPEESKWNEDTK